MTPTHRRKQMRKWRAAHPEYFKQKTREYRQEKPFQYMLSRKRLNAKKLGIPFTITLSDLIIPTHCPWLGIPLFWSNKPGKQRDNTPSIDRVDNTKGYIPGNVEIISCKANRMKNNATLQDIARMGKRATRLLGE